VVVEAETISANEPDGGEILPPDDRPLMRDE
jgi:hypothetical protein